MESYFLVTTGPDFMQPMYTRGFILCRAKIDLVIPALKESSNLSAVQWCYTILLKIERFPCWHTNIDMNIIISFYIEISIPHGKGS
jgi:hypothetical protein